MRKKKEPIELDLTQAGRLWTRINRYATPGAGGCIEWSADHSRDGYAVMVARATDGKHKASKVHRVVYMLVTGRQLGTDQLHHECHNRGCINFLHVTPMASVAEHKQEHWQVVCKRGHPLEGYNVILTTDGRRRCRTCANERSKLHSRAKSTFHRGAHKTECRNGHPWTPENVYVRSRGHSECRTCHREREARRQARMREARP